MSAPPAATGWVPFTGAAPCPRQLHQPQDACTIEITGRVMTAPRGGSTASGAPSTSLLITVNAQPGALVPLFSVRAYDALALEAAHLQAGAHVTVRGALSVRQSRRDGLGLWVRADTITPIEEPTPRT